MRLRNILKSYLLLIIGLLLIAGCSAGSIPDNPLYRSGGPGDPPAEPQDGECEGVDENEPNWDFTAANFIDIGVAAYGCVQEGTDYWDTWRFTLIQDSVVDISLLNDGEGDIDLVLYDSDTNWLMGSGNHGAGESEYLSHINLNGGMYYVRVEADYDSGPYAAERHYHLILTLIQEYDAYCETEPNGIDDPDVFPYTYDPEYYGCITGLIADESDEDWYFFEPDEMGANAWQTEIVDSEGDVGGTPKMDIDSNGNPHICYVDVDHWDLKYAWHDGATWQIDTPFDGYIVNGMVLDSNDYPHVSFIRDSSYTPLVYAYYDGTEWHQTVIDSSPGGTESGITLDENDHPHMAWDGSGGNLRYTYFDGSSWHEESVYSGGAYPAIGAELDIDQAGYPHITHCQNYSPLQLYHSWKDTSGWHTEVVAAPGYNAAMEIDSNDNIHIAYYKGSGAYSDKDLMYAFNEGSGWDITTVDTTGNFDNVDLAIDSNNLPHISSRDQETDSLKYAHFNGSNWSNQTPDAAGHVAKGTSIGMLPGDVPCIAYYDDGSGDLKFAKPGVGDFYYDYKGFLTVALVGYDLEVGDSLTVLMYDETYALLDSKTIGAGDYCTSVRLPYGGVWQQRLYIKVEGNSDRLKYDLHPLLNPTYSSSETFYESESNNSSSSADMMPLDYDPDNDNWYLTGIFVPGDMSDDWYRIDTPESGMLMVHVSDYDIAPGNEWVSVDLYDSSMANLDSYTILHGDGSRCLSTGGVVAAGTYYVKLSTNTWRHRYVIEPIFVGTGL